MRFSSICGEVITRRLSLCLLAALAVASGCDPNAGPRGDATTATPSLPHPSEASAPPSRPIAVLEPSLRPVASSPPELLHNVGAAPSLPGSTSTRAVASQAAAGGPSPAILFEDLVTGARGYYATSGSTLGAFTQIATVPSELRLVASADFTGDNIGDLLFENTRDGSRWVLQLTSSAVPVTWLGVNVMPTEWHIAGAAPLSNGATPDILWQNTLTGEIGLYRMSGTTILGWTSIGRVEADLRMVGVGDFTGDGRLDLVFENVRDGGRWILQMNGTTAVAWRAIGPVPTDLAIRGVGDFTGDGQLDLLFENTRDGSRWVLRMIGTAAQAWIALATLPVSWHIAGTRTAAPTGSLAVTIVGLPNGVPANVSVTGTNFNAPVTATSTLSNLAPGAYTVAAATVTTNGVTYTPTASSQAVSVSANLTTNATVTYGVPDLVLTTASGAATGAIGGTVSVSATVRNQGATTTGAFRLGFYLSTDATITTADVPLGFCTYSGGLAANTSSTCSGPVPVPSSLTPGTYVVGAIADDLSQLSESNETNNTRASATTTMLVPLASLPDFVVDVVTAPATGTLGGTISVSATVRNQAGATTSAFRIGFYYSTDATISSADLASGSGCTLAGGLAANASSTCTVTMQVPNGLSPGAYFVGAIVDDVLQVAEGLETNNTRAAATATTLTSGGGGPSSGYNIDIRFLTAMTPSQQAAFTNAAARWSSIITGDIPDAPLNAPAGACGSNVPALNETVDDLVIFATIEPIDGPGGILGSAGPCFSRSGSNLPIVGVMRFDAADVASLESSGQLNTVILHEMGHILGIGTLWSSFNFLQNPSTPGGASLDTYYSGANGIAGFNAIGGSAYTGGNKAPVENLFDAGTINAHWRESVLGNELMTGFVNQGANPLSRLTAQSLMDFGYVVNVAAADPFFLNLNLHADAASLAGAIPLGNDILIGPLYTVGLDGAIRRIR